MDKDKYIGRLLDNRYEILEVIGIGGMAVVYKARCHRLNRLVAIKILKEEYSQDEEFRRRFHAESQAVAMLSHPNIVSVYDVSTSDEADYIVMELIDGITLKQYMEKKGVLNWKETLHFAIQIAKALEHAHSRGIVHRDIKPHNVMVLKNGSVKVADFGIARVMSKSNTLTKEALGSVHYISPEQAKGGRVDNRSDIYSLGVVMYEMMTGRPPYDGESPVAVAIQHINGGAPMPSTLNPNIPGGLEQIIMKAMAHEPNARYSSATAMLYDMDEFRKDPTILFDYHTPPLDDVTRIHSGPLVTEIPSQPPKTTAERVAAGRTEPPRTRTEQTSGRISRNPANNPSNHTSGTRTGSNAGTTQRKRREEEEAEEEDRSRVATIAIVVCSLVAIVAIGIFLFTLLNGGVSGPEEEMVTIPYLIGKDYDSLSEYTDVIIKLENRVASEEFEKGLIIQQNPEGGTQKVKGTTVYVTVSLGPEPQVKFMTKLEGVEEENARNYLIGQGVDAANILTKKEASDEVEAGLVTRTEPAEGEELADGQTVTLWISTGPNVVTAPMPYVVGRTYEMAVNVLNASGFTNVYPEYVDNDAPEGQVVGQSVERNEDTDVTTMIILQVSNGPTEPSVEPTTEPPTEPPTEPSVPTVTKTVIILLPEELIEEEYKLLIMQNDDELYNLTINPGTTSIQVNFTGSGIQYYDLYINEIFFKAEKVDFTTP